MRAWWRTCADGVGEIFAFQAQRLYLIEVRDSNGAIAIGDDGVGMNVGTLVVDFEHLGLVHIIIHSHPGITNHGDAASLAGMQPAHVNMSVHAIVEFEVKM